MFAIATADQNNGSVYERAHAFIAQEYKRAFQTAPPPIQQVVVGYESGDIVGTLGIDTFRDGNTPRLARIYSVTQAPFSCCNHKVMEFGRLLSCRPKSCLSAVLILHAALHAREQGLSYGWCEMRPGVIRRLSRLGITFHPVEAELHFDQVPASDRAYYHGHEPGFHMVDLAQVIEALQRSLVATAYGRYEDAANDEMPIAA